MTVERILKEKGNHAPTVAPDAKIANVIAALESEDVGALVVSVDGQHIDGIISERDVVRGLLSFGPRVLEHEVRDLMTKNVITCTASDRVALVLAQMDNQKIRHVPVVDHGKLVGIVSILDIVKLKLDEIQTEADAIREYFVGSR